jgi:hypothetical protein
MSSSRSRFSGCRARGLYPLARGCRIRPALRMAPALLGCWIAGGAGVFRFSVLAGGAVELPGRSRPAPGVLELRRGTQCRALAPDFPAAALAVFIPWRGAAGFDRRSGWYPRCWGVGSRAAPAFSIKGNKAIADQPPLLKPLYKESRFQRTSTRQQLDYAKTQLLCSQENRRIPTFDGLSTCS